MLGAVGVGGARLALLGACRNVLASWSCLRPKSLVRHELRAGDYEKLSCSPPVSLAKLAAGRLAEVSSQSITAKTSNTN